MLLADHLGELADHLIGQFVDQARHSGASWTEIGAGHLLLALIEQPDSLAVHALTAQNLGLTAVRDAAIASLPEPAGDAPEPVLVPFDARAKKALELTFREALRLQHERVGTGHILLALLEEEPAGGVLGRAGVRKAAVENTVLTGPQESARQVA
ncbi:Clp protease N-terminal domain-containing protein [Actinoplanes sp. CA-015351]|uniref:Clp protease N-terminal domain-containing protein n=1 Tax=Actinoplanes sp. CA-015351 TaxID=3239897 RepID=UPI003D955A6F